MFRSGSFEDEIYKSMEKQLVSNQVENKRGFNKLVKAADFLSAAAEIFEQAGMQEESDDITKVLQDLANQLGK